MKKIEKLRKIFKIIAMIQVALSVVLILTTIIMHDAYSDGVAITAIVSGIGILIGFPVEIIILIDIDDEEYEIKKAESDKRIKEHREKLSEYFKNHPIYPG